MAAELTSVDQIRPVLEWQPLAVLTDIDGTLSPIVDRAEDAFVPEGIKKALAALVERGVKVAAITGRPLEAARRMVGVEGVDYAAGHGVDMLIGGERIRPAGVEEWEKTARSAVEDLRALERRDGVVVEDKGFGIAIHYRRAKDAAAARAEILSAIEASGAASRFAIQDARLNVEMRPMLRADKGTAAAAMIERLGAMGVLCLGDDVTDIDMFREVRRLREGPDPIGAAIVAVRSEEASAEVAASADYWLDGVDGVAWLLEEAVRLTVQGRRGGR